MLPSPTMRDVFLMGFRKGCLQAMLVGSPIALVILAVFGGPLQMLVGLLIFVPFGVVGVVGLQREWWR